ncbi:hypothetical protein B0H13DRAFT_145047 [Mycena leptocephala]|nr:hypothetical protein B0H13DRAFT_145047 [Mycena leptocephala]
MHLPLVHFAALGTLSFRTWGVPCNSIQTTLGLSWIIQFFNAPFSSEDFVYRLAKEPLLFGISSVAYFLGDVVLIFLLPVVCRYCVGQLRR